MSIPLYDMQKLKTIFIVAGSIGVSVLVLNMALALCSAAYPNWLPRQFFGVDFIVDNRQRALAAAARYRDGTLGADDPFVLVLGLSSASEGISLQDLSTRTADGTRFLGLTGGGRNMRDAARYARPLLGSDVQPELLVLAINLFHLLDPPPAAEAFRENLMKQETIENLRGYWLINRRKDVKYVADAGIDQLRSAVFDVLNARFLDEQDPWREIMRMGLPQATLKVHWERNVQAYAERGYFQAGNYGRSSKQAEIYADIVAAFQQRGTDVVVVLMPEHSALRERIPGAAFGLLQVPARGGSNDGSPDIFDFRDAVPDSGFTDISHMNEEGRRLFSPMLGDLIATRLGEIRRAR